MPPSVPAPSSASPVSAVAKAPVRKLPGEAVDDASMQKLLPPESEEDSEDPNLPPHPGGFMNQPWVQNVLPFATSLLFHVTIIVLGIVLWKAAPMLVNPNKEQVIIPDSKSIEKNAMPGGIEHPGLNNDKTRDAAQDLIKNSPEDGFTSSVSNNIQQAAGGGVGSEESSAFEGASNSTGKGTSGAGGAGQAFGSGSGGGTAPWGVPGGGGGLLPKSNFFGTGGNATKVIYLCDASGSMLSVFGALKQQLKESVNALDVTAGQEFNIIIFSDDNCFPLFKDPSNPKMGAMQIASAENKKLAMDFIDNAVSTGGTQPLPAIREALREKPELLYVLTDGFDQIANFDDVLNAFKIGNPDGKMHINCIFLQSDEDPKLEEVLKSISTQGHGVFKKILKSDM
jgi:hypothetical protein